MSHSKLIEENLIKKKIGSSYGRNKFFVTDKTESIVKKIKIKQISSTSA